MDINECFDMALDPEELRKRETSLDTQVWVAASLFMLYELFAITYCVFDK